MVLMPFDDVSTKETSDGCIGSLDNEETEKPVVTLSLDDEWRSLVINSSADKLVSREDLHSETNCTEEDARGTSLVLTFGSSTIELKYHGKSSLEILTAELSGVWISELERVGRVSVPGEDVTVGVRNDARCGDEVICFDDTRNSLFAMFFVVLNTFNLPDVDKLKGSTDDEVAKKSALVIISFLADKFRYSESGADLGNNDEDIDSTNNDDDNDDHDNDECEGDKPSEEKGDSGNRGETGNKDEDTIEDHGKDNEKDENDDDEVGSEKGDIREDERDEDAEEEGEVVGNDSDDMVGGKDEGDKEVEDMKREGKEVRKANEDNHVDDNEESEDGDEKGE